jgi:Tol biopolymer transport system component
LLFDSYASEGAVSPDGQRILFTREGSSPYRKGYVGARASQIWIFDLASKNFTWLHAESEIERRYPLWMPNGKGFYYSGQQSGNFNLWQHDLESGEEKQLTFYDDDAVLFPTLSQDGSTIVFRRLFDFYVFRPGRDKEPKRIEIWNDADSLRPNVERRRMTQAASAGFTRDGLEIALIADNDLWVMDTVLREPRQITRTAAEEREALFTPDTQTILFIRDDGHGRNLFAAKRKDATKAWWENLDFSVDRLTTHGLVNGGLSVSPDGKKIAYLCGAGISGFPTSPAATLTGASLRPARSNTTGRPTPNGWPTRWRIRTSTATSSSVAWRRPTRRPTTFRASPISRANPPGRPTARSSRLSTSPTTGAPSSATSGSANAKKRKTPTSAPANSRRRAN